MRLPVLRVFATNAHRKEIRQPQILQLQANTCPIAARHQRWVNFFASPRSTPRTLGKSVEFSRP